MEKQVSLFPLLLSPIACAFAFLLCVFQARTLMTSVFFLSVSFVLVVIHNLVLEISSFLVEAWGSPSRLITSQQCMASLTLEALSC